MKWIRKIILAVFLLGTLTIGTVVYMLGDPEVLRNDIEKIASAELARPVMIRGSLSWQFFPSITLVLKDIAVADTKTEMTGGTKASQLHSVEIHKATVSTRLIDLLSQPENWVIQEIALKGLYLVSDTSHYDFPSLTLAPLAFGHAMNLTGALRLSPLKGEGSNLDNSNAEQVHFEARLSVDQLRGRDPYPQTGRGYGVTLHNSEINSPWLNANCSGTGEITPAFFAASTGYSAARSITTGASNPQAIAFSGPELVANNKMLANQAIKEKEKNAALISAQVEANTLASEALFDPSMLLGLSGSGTCKLLKFTNPFHLVESVAVDASLSNGVILVDGKAKHGAGPPARFNLNLDGNQASPVWRLKTKADAIGVAEILRSFESDLDWRGSLNLNSLHETTGITLAALIKNLTGEVEFNGIDGGMDVSGINAIIEKIGAQGLAQLKLAPLTNPLGYAKLNASWFQKGEQGTLKMRADNLLLDAGGQFDLTSGDMSLNGSIIVEARKSAAAYKEEVASESKQPVTNNLGIKFPKFLQGIPLKFTCDGSLKEPNCKPKIDIGETIKRSINGMTDAKIVSLREKLNDALPERLRETKSRLSDLFERRRNGAPHKQDLKKALEQKQRDLKQKSKQPQDQ